MTIYPHQNEPEIVLTPNGSLRYLGERDSPFAHPFSQDWREALFDLTAKKFPSTAYLPYDSGKNSPNNI